MRVRGSYTMGQAAPLPPGLTPADLTGSDPWNRARVAAAMGQPDMIDWATLDPDQTRAIQQALSNVMTTSRADPMMQLDAPLTDVEIARLQMRARAAENAARYAAEDAAMEMQRQTIIAQGAPTVEPTDAQRALLRAQIQENILTNAAAQGQTVIDASGVPSVIVNQASAPSFPRSPSPSPAMQLPPDYSGDGFSQGAAMSADFPASQGGGSADNRGMLKWGALALLGALLVLR